ncbi:unnamed protein product [Gadus morhua 'NCC']
MAVINRCVLPLLVVLAAAACVTHGQERIKMCGRDLIRLAVTSCGSSRMRRSTAESQQGQLAGDHGLPVQEHQGPSGSTGTPLQLDQNPQTQHPKQDLKQDQNQDPNWDPNRDQDRHPDREQDPELSLVPGWYGAPYRVRRSAGRISDVCCEKGCSMRELIQFC